MSPPIPSLRKWVLKSASLPLSVISFTAFTFLDFLEIIFCIIYRYLDEFFEGKAYPCYCENRGLKEENEISETLNNRKNIFRQMGFLGFTRKWENCKKSSSNNGGGGGILKPNKWSDCGCEYCVSWHKDDSGDHNLHVVVREPSIDSSKKNCCEELAENVIFLHGFLSSSSFWTETVFPNLSEQNYRLIAFDLLGFGKSPKPKDCFYTLTDHLEMIEKSVINPFELKSFHLVAHSMGCIIGLALAAKYPNRVRSITLVAPPYFTSSKESTSLKALDKLAGKRLWPPLLFGSSFMSWYEHLGRCVCFLVCRNHRFWERILKLLTWRRDLHFMVVDLTKHTHHSAWHTMHNVVCGGAKYLDDFLETLVKSEVKISVIHGDGDIVVPLECSSNIKRKFASAEMSVISYADHVSVIIGREKDFTLNLEHVFGRVRNENGSIIDKN